MSDVVGTDRRHSQRQRVHAKVEFIIEGTGELLTATSVDLSEEGIRFDSDHPLTLSLRYELDGETHLKVGRLVWAKRTDDGRMTYAMDFTDSE